MSYSCDNIYERIMDEYDIDYINKKGFDIKPKENYKVIDAFQNILQSCHAIKLEEDHIYAIKHMIEICQFEMDFDIRRFIIDNTPENKVEELQEILHNYIFGSGFGFGLGERHFEDDELDWIKKYYPGKINEELMDDAFLNQDNDYMIPWLLKNIDEFKDLTIAMEKFEYMHCDAFELNEQLWPIWNAIKERLKENDAEIKHLNDTIKTMKKHPLQS